MMSSVEITDPPPIRQVLAANVALSERHAIKKTDLAIPGALVSVAKDVMRGHGTYAKGDELISSVGGVIEQVNKLIRVKPVKCRYQGEIGDVVVGRIVEVQQKRWKVELNSRFNGALLLASVNLPGGELRRKSIEDELAMREYLREGDLVSAEVQQCFNDGALSLHTRSLKYGKLGQGVLVQVPAHLIRRSKSHFCNFPFGASVILGCNGYLWVSRPITDDEAGQTGGYVEDLKPVPVETRDVVARLVNCVRILARGYVPIGERTIASVYQASLRYPTKALIRIELMDLLIDETVRACRAEDEDMI